MFTRNKDHDILAAALNMDPTYDHNDPTHRVAGSRIFLDREDNNMLI